MTAQLAGGSGESDQKLVLSGLGRLVWPAILTAGSLAVFLKRADLLAHLDRFAPQVIDARGGTLAFAVAAGLATAWLISRGFQVLVARAMARKGRRPPRLLYELTATLLFVSALVVTVSVAFDQSLLGVLATSGVLVAILGFALRNIIADIFSGIALSLESPYRIGDWIETEPGISGRVVEVSWRSTRIETRNQIQVVLPNSRIAAGRLTNYSAPQPHYRVQLPIILDGDVPVARTKRILLTGVSVAPGIRSVPQPDVQVDGYTETGIRYLIRYWIPSFADEADCRDAVLASIDRQLRTAGIGLAPARHRVVLERSRSRGDDARAASIGALHRLPGFEHLDPADIDTMAAAAKPLTLSAGERIGSQHDPSTLFILVEGLLAILDEDRREIALLRPGDAFPAVAPALAAEPEAGPAAPVVLAKTEAALVAASGEGLRVALGRSPRLADAIERAMRRSRAGFSQFKSARRGATAARLPKREVGTSIWLKIARLFG